MKKSVITLLITAVLLSLTACGGGATPDSASPDTATADQTTAIRHNLVSSVKSYRKDSAQGDWVLDNTTTVKYDDKANPTLFTTVTEGDKEHPVQTKCEYVYEGDLPVTRIETDDSSHGGTTAEYKNGRLDKVTYDNTESNIVYKWMYQYSDSSEYYTLGLSEIRGESTGPNAIGNSEEVASVDVTTENGLLRKTVKTGVGSYWLDGENKKWESSSDIYVAEYDDDGIIEQLYDPYDTDRKTIWHRFIVTRSGGTITEVTCQRHESDDSWTDLVKSEFEYNDIEISPVRYSLMMNRFIADYASNYYTYNWY